MYCKVKHRVAVLSSKVHFNSNNCECTLTAVNSPGATWKFCVIYCQAQEDIVTSQKRGKGVDGSRRISDFERHEDVESFYEAVLMFSGDIVSFQIDRAILALLNVVAIRRYEIFTDTLEGHVPVSTLIFFPQP